MAATVSPRFFESEGTLARSTKFTGTEGVYMLPHHAKEIDRLRRQHRFMASTTDGVLLATPNIYGPGDFVVLDAGCADGTWLRDLPRQLQGRKLDLYGVDIGSDLFPTVQDPEATFPVDLRSHDLLQPFPSSWNWVNKFDVVHQRLLIWGIRSEDWPTVVQNLVQTLKPGGYIQLVEAEWINPQDPATLPQLKKQAILQEWSTKNFGMDIHIAYQLEDILRGAGLQNVTKLQYDHGYGLKARVEEQQGGSAELWVECFRSLDSKIGPEGIPGVAQDKKEFHRFLDDLEVEIKTFGYQPKLNFVYGQKPS